MQTFRDPVPLGGPSEDDDLPLTMNARIGEAWQDMTRSTRRLIAEDPSEGRLLFFVIASDVVFFLSWTLKTLLAPTSAAVAQMPTDIGIWLTIALLFRTASLYALAAAATGVCRLLGGRGSWRDTRAGVFWGALVSAPFGLLAAALGLALSRGEDLLPMLQNPLFALPPYYIGLVPFLWFVASGIAAAQRFTQTGWTFLSLSVATVALSVIGVYLSG